MNTNENANQTPLSDAKINEIVNKAKTFTAAMFSGNHDIKDVRSNPVALAAQYGLTILPENHKIFTEFINSELDNDNIQTTEHLKKHLLGGESAGCKACKYGLTAALCAIAVLLLAAVVAAAEAFTEGTATAVIGSFCRASFKMLGELILASGAAIALAICDHFVCK